MAAADDTWSQQTCGSAPDIFSDSDRVSLMFICTDFVLTQPVATVLAAMIAVIAAGIAYAGVRQTVTNTRKETRRKEKVELLVEGSLAIRLYVGLIMDLRHLDPDGRSELMTRHLDEASTKFDAWALAHIKLTLYDFDNVADSMRTVGALASDSWGKLSADPTLVIDFKQIDRELRSALEVFRSALRSLK